MKKRIIAAFLAALMMFSFVGCGAGVSRLKTSSGISLPLLSQKIGEVNMSFLHNNVACYVPLEQGRGGLTVLYNGQTYHAFAPNEIEPE